MKRVAAVVAVMAGLLASCATPLEPASAGETRDRLSIRHVKFLNASSPEFVVIAVTADYALVSSAEGNVALALELGPGAYTPVSEQRIRRGAGAVELMAACKRADHPTQGLAITLAEYPGARTRRTFASEKRTVTLPAAPRL